MIDRLTWMLEMQRELQLKMPSGDPALLEGDARAQFLTWNVTALTDEIHEALGETGWKPWATSRHLRPFPMLKELVDAWHFFMNILLVIAAEAGLTEEELMDKFVEAYETKNKVNAQRQADGYDGVSTKCPSCKRELSETNSFQHITGFDQKVYCSPACWAKAPGTVLTAPAQHIPSATEAEAMQRHLELQQQAHFNQQNQRINEGR